MNNNEQIPDDLQWMLAFCAKPRDRKDMLDAPFTQGDWTYATDGIVGVRISRKILLLGTQAPDLGKVFAAQFAAQSFYPAPTIHLPDHKLTVMRCDHCYDGKHHDCPDCECECSNCNGTGRETRDNDSRASVTFPFGSFQRSIVRRVWRLPGLKIAADVLAPAALPFTFDGGGEGLMMPQMTPYSDNIVVEMAVAA